MTDTEYVFVIGGMISSLDKGVISASLGKLLQAKDYKVTIQEFDPYVNIDLDTLSPCEHGGYYVTVGGREANLDLGHHERFLDVQTTRVNDITTGRIHQSVINKECKGDYLGRTVQVVPCVVDEIKCNAKLLGSKYKFDFVVIEIGGTVGDIEPLPFAESICQLRWGLGKSYLHVHPTCVPYIIAVKEYKTKLIQHFMRRLQKLDIQPDMLVLHTEYESDANLLRKVVLFCNAAGDSVIQPIDVPTTYGVSLVLQRQKMGEAVLRKVGVGADPTPELEPWGEFPALKSTATDMARAGLADKYVELQDAYKSIDESLLQTIIYSHHKLGSHLFHSEKLDNENVIKQLKSMDGILIAPGFGQRDTEGKFTVIKYARKHDVPCLGICLGMQYMVIKLARDVLGLTDTSSTEMKPSTAHRVIDLMEEQKSVTDIGGSMRLGTYSYTLKEGSKVLEVYGKEHIQERHRHRFEFNNGYKKQYETTGMMYTGENPETNLVEVIETPTSKWFVGIQYHPEYNSTVVSPNPLFLSFVKAAIENKE